MSKGTFPRWHRISRDPLGPWLSPELIGVREIPVLGISIIPLTGVHSPVTDDRFDPHLPS